MGSQRDPGEQQRRPHFTERYLYSQSVLVIIMCDSSETQTNGGQEIPETSEAPEAVEPVGVEEAEKKEEVAEPEPVDVEGAEKKEEVAEPEPEAVAEAEAQNTEDNQATEPSGSSDTTEEKKEEASSETEKTTTCLTNESNSTEKDIEDANRKTAKTVAGILTRVKEDTEMTKRQDNMGSYSTTMDELSGLLETQSGQNSKLLTDNTNLGERMSKLIGETQK